MYIHQNLFLILIPLLVTDVNVTIGGRVHAIHFQGLLLSGTG
jgi:hypothetical protein